MPSSMGDITAMASANRMAGPGFPMQQQQQQGRPYPLMIDPCAGCGAVDVPLLACDDLDSAGKNKDGIPVVANPSQRARFCANCMIGKKVRVFWPVDNSWYIGTVQQFNPATGEHLLKYEDDDTEWVHIGESNTTINPAEMNPHQGQPSGGPPQPNGFPARPELSSSTTGLKVTTLPESTGTDGNTAANPTPSSGTTLSSSPTSSVGATSSHAQVSNPSTGTGPVPVSESSSNLPHISNRSFGSVPPQGTSYPHHVPPGQHQIPPPLSHHHSQIPSHGYNHGPGAPPTNMSSMYSGPGNYSSAPHGHGAPMGYGYPGHHGMPMPQRHGLGPSGPPHPYGGFHGLPHRMDGPSQISNTSGSANNSSGTGKKKTGPKAWTKEEDALLLSIVQSMRIPMKWSLVAQSLPERTGKQCRERYVNHLNPRLKVTDWSPTEDATIFHLYNTIGSHWAKMSKIIPGRTDNGIKNRFHNLRRQLEREDEHRLRLNATRDFPEEIRLELIRDFPRELRGKAAELWDIKSGLSVLAAQSVLGGDRTRTAGRFGPFRDADPGEESCVRCGFLLPSVQTGSQICTKTGWCQSCARIPPHVSGNMLRECLNLRRCQDPENRKIIESWKIPAPLSESVNEENTEETKQ